MDLSPQNFNPEHYIEAVAVMPDGEIDLAQAALAIAAREHPGLSLDRYGHHLKKLAEDVSKRFDDLIKEGAADTAETRLAALKHIIADQEGYAGDEETYDDLQNADLIRVIDRRKGMPITLALLYIHAGRAQGWEVQGLNFPGHFLIRIDHEERRLIADPFHEVRILQASDMRALLKEHFDKGAELASEYYEPADNREILIRLQNNIKLRQIEGEDYEGALKTVESMRDIDPDEFRLLFDAGVLYARTGKPQKAAKALEGYIDQAPRTQDRHDAALLLQQIKEELGE